MNLIFDFDGTIVDSMEAFIAVFNKNIRDNKDPLSPEEIQILQGMSSRRAIKHIGVHWWQIPKLILKGIPDFRALIPQLDTFEGLPETLKALAERGDKLFIVTSNTHETVGIFLKQHKLDQYFSGIKTGASLFKKSGYIRKLMKEQGLKRKESIYIGDETRDIHAARLARIKIASVTWGFNTEEILKKQHPNFLVTEPNQLLKISL
jgi:phosphoglycolate phosphatase